MLGTGMRRTLMFQRKGSLYLAVGGDKAEAAWATTSPQVSGPVWGTLCPSNLCRARDGSSPSVMVSLVNTLIREVSGRDMARRQGAWGQGTPTSVASHHCAARGVAWLGGDALGKRTEETGGLEAAWGSHLSRGEETCLESPMAAATLALPFSPP